MEKEFCFLFKNERKIGWRKRKWFNEPFTCKAHKYSSALKEFAEHHPHALIVGEYVEYKKRVR